VDITESDKRSAIQSHYWTNSTTTDTWPVLIICPTEGRKLSWPNGLLHNMTVCCTQFHISINQTHRRVTVHLHNATTTRLEHHGSPYARLQFVT